MKTPVAEDLTHLSIIEGSVVTISISVRSNNWKVALNISDIGKNLSVLKIIIYYF